MTSASFMFVGLGGLIGSILRYLVSLALQSSGGYPRFPYATLIVNVVGCFLIGAAATYTSKTGEPLSEGARLFIMTGVLGGFTTFSAFGLETLQLLRAPDMQAAILNSGANLVLGLLAVWGGSVVFGRIG